MQRNVFLVIFLIFVVAVGCTTGPKTAPIASDSQRQGCSDTLGFSGRWKLVNIHDSGKNIKPTISDSLVVSECSIIEHYVKHSLVKRDTFRLYRMINACTDFQLIYKNDSIGCINIIKDTLVFSECSDFETARYFFKRM